jgi:membrane-anchored protein YejM (alkaline phosphatase superfamily)
MAKSFESASVAECDGAAYGRLLTRTDPRKLCTETTKSRVWVGYLEYGIEHHSDHLPKKLRVGEKYASNYRLTWDSKDSGIGEFHIVTTCQHGQLRTVIGLGQLASGGRTVGDPR